MFICPVTKRTIERVDNTYLVYNLIQHSNVLPPEIVDLIFRILFYNGCMILASGTITNFNNICKRQFAIFISFPYNTETVLKQELIYPNLLSVIIHKNIKKIDSNSFYNSQKMKEPIFPESIIHINHYAFESCKKFQRIVLPKNLKYLGDKVFINCINLKEIMFNDNIEYLGGYIIMNTQIEDIILPKSLKVIDRHCFYKCDNLKSIKILNKFKVNETHYSFWDEKKETYYNGLDGFMIINTGAFWCNTHSLEKIILPLSREEITEKDWDSIFPKDTFNWTENIIDLGNGEKEYIYVR